MVLYLFLFAEDPEDAFQDLRGAFPFGGRGTLVDTTDPVPTPDDPSPDIDKHDRLRKLSEHPVAEGGAYTFVKDEKTYVRYISRGEGNLYEVEIGGEGHVLLLGNDEGVFSGAHRVSWLDEDNVLIYSLENSGYDAKIATVTFSEDDDGFMWSGNRLPEETLAYAVSPGGNSFFYTVKEGSGVDGFTSTFTGTGSVTGQHVFSSQIREWVAEWASSNAVTLTTKPSGYVEGHMYLLNPQNRAVSHALRGIEGLVTKTNNNASFTLYNESLRNDVSLKLFNHQEKTNEEVSGLKTLVDKCVWKEKSVFICAVPNSLPSHLYPDAWYQGKVSFNDSVFKKINIDTKKTEVFLNPGQVRTGFANVDAYSLFFDSSNNYFFFTDKKTGDLWVYETTKTAQTR